MQCREARDLLDSFLGQELLVETNHDVMRHLDGCPECRAELAARRQLRGILQRSFNRTATLQPRPEFAAEVLKRVRATGTHGARRPAVKTWGALAATLVLVAAGGLL